MDLRNTTEINELIQHIQIDDRKSGFECMCCGDPTFEFYNGDALLAELGFHHGRSLRWPGGRWEGDSLLQKGSAEFMIEWLEKHGVTGPRKQVEESRLRREKAEASWNNWLSATPEPLKPLSKRNSVGRDDLPRENMLAALGKAYPDPNERIRALLKWYGSGEGAWSGYPAYEDVPEQLLLTYKTSDILAAIEASPLNDTQLEGAARLFGGWTFSQQRPEDLNLLSRDLKQRLLEHSLKSAIEDNRRRATRAFGKNLDAPAA